MYNEVKKIKCKLRKLNSNSKNNMKNKRSIAFWYVSSGWPQTFEKVFPIF